MATKLIPFATSAPPPCAARNDCFGRRAIMQAGVIGAMAAFGLGAGCGGPDGPEVPNGPIQVGNVDDVPVGRLGMLRSANVLLGRDGDGLYAMSGLCSHAGCRLAIASRADPVLRCPCHGSAFDRFGEVARGPATASLVHYRVDLDGAGNIVIQGGQRVAASARTPVP